MSDASPSGPSSRPSRSHPAGPHRSTPRIAVVSHRLGSDAYEREVVSGIVDAAAARGASVLCFAIKGVEKDFDGFVGAQNMDAVVLLSGPLTHALGVEALEAFCARRRHLPLVSIGAPLSGSGATVRADGAAGVRKAIAHLVEVHGRRRIGFIRGPDKTTIAVNERFQGYKQGLAEQGIALNQEWITSSSDLEGGEQPIRVLFDERKQDLEAVITFNDGAAIGALAALVQRAIPVPQGVAIIGCHDIPEVDRVVPPITTVTQKLHEQGWRAANLVLDALEGKALSDQLIEAELVLRRSCGCFPKSVLEVRVSAPLAPPSSKALGSEDRKQEIALAMTRILGLGESRSGERLLAAFWSDLDAGPGSRRFLLALDERLNRMARLGTDLSRWEEAITAMRRRLLPSLLHDEVRRSLAEDLWHEARVLIGDTAQRAQAFHRMLDQKGAHAFGGISQSLIAAKDIEELGEALARGLPHLGVKSCHISLYDDVQSRETSTLVLGIEEGGRKTYDSATFATERLAPEGALRQLPASVTAVLPLAFKDEQRGVILLEAAPNQTMSYDELREQFGAAFKRMEGERELVRLHAAQRERVEELERAHNALRENQEKLLVSERMASLGRLTAGMAHEMSTPLAAMRAALGEIQELVSEYRASIGVAEVTPKDHAEIADEMEVSTKLADSAAQRVAAFVRGIKAETRDLSSTEPAYFDPVPVIEEMLLLLSHAARSANCTVTLKPRERAMNLFGSPIRLSQVISNLVTNAIDASAEKGGGPIEVELVEWERGLELCVSDRGVGIAPENLGKIFYPMYTSKPFGVGTGLGLAIVHDIVTGHFNGTIQVESRVGEGTTFTLRLTNPG